MFLKGKWGTKIKAEIKRKMQANKVRYIYVHLTLDFSETMKLVVIQCCTIITYIDYWLLPSMHFLVVTVMFVLI